MQLIIKKDYEELSSFCAQTIITHVKESPETLFCLAAGDTPRKTYQEVARIAKAEGIDFSRCEFVALDEWLGIPPSNEGSCQYFLRHNLFEPLGIRESHIRFFDAMTDQPGKECTRISSYVKSRGGIGMMVVGIGKNGHIGFNEPGTSFDQDVHFTDLDETTRTVGQKYFSGQTALYQGITLGLKQLTESQNVILLASGSGKAEIIRQTLEDPIDPSIPASIIRTHAGGMTVLDEAAANLLKKI